MFKYVKAGLLSLVFSAGSAMAGSSSGPITQVIVHEPNVAIFAAGPHINKPACHTQGEQWAFLLDTPAGKAMYALLLTAKAEGRSVNVTGQSGCTAWGDRETPLFIQLLD